MQVLLGLAQAACETARGTEGSHFCRRGHAGATENGTRGREQGGAPAQSGLRLGSQRHTPPLSPQPPWRAAEGGSSWCLLWPDDPMLILCPGDESSMLVARSREGRGAGGGEVVQAEGGLMLRATR